VQVTVRRDNDRKLQTSIGNRNTLHGGNALFARVAAKDLKTFSSATISSPPSPPQNIIEAKKRRSFRSEFEFRLKTEVLNNDTPSREKDEKSVEEETELYFTRLKKQLENDSELES